jgi:myo-inositol 2-dehydrogenase/D-chiro-inositol 1-dehydrogenase
VLTIGHEMRLSQQYGRVKALIDAGEIGVPRYLAFTLFRFPFRPGAGGWRYDQARVGSWILEEPVHFFDFAMWCFERVGPPLAVLALGDAGEGGPGMSRNFSAVLRFPGGAHAVISQTLGGFEYHQHLAVVGSEGSIRSWWSGALDRALSPTFELRVERRGTGAVETIPVAQSGELVELAVQAREVVAAFGEGRAVVSGDEARTRIAVCLAAEQSLREAREIPLRL